MLSFRKHGAAVAAFSAASLPLCLLAGSPAVLYELRPGSFIRDECQFCDRATIERPLQGTFNLTFKDQSGDFLEYELSGIDWKDSSGDYPIRGGGSYRKDTGGSSQELSLQVDVGAATGVALASGQTKLRIGCWPAFEALAAEGTSPARDPSHVLTIQVVAAPKTTYIPYDLLQGEQGSYLTRDCPPCAGPPTILIPLGGTFLLGKIEENPLYVTYRIEGIDFKNTGGASDTTVKGSGCYSQGGEVALLQNMDLQVTINTTSDIVLSSGRGTLGGAQFPQIEIDVKGPDPSAPIFEYAIHLVAKPAVERPAFRRGDANADGKIDISDAVKTLFWLFSGDKQPTCLDAADANGDGRNDVADAVYGLLYLFQSGKPPPAPGPTDCGTGPDAAPGCLSYPPCAATTT